MKKISNKGKIEALKKSITHWEENKKRAKAGKEIHYSSNTCPLCRIYSPANRYTCGECPLKKEEALDRSCCDEWSDIARAVYYEHALIRKINTLIKRLQAELIIAMEAK
jgi:hypothetical protein